MASSHNVLAQTLLHLQHFHSHMRPALQDHWLRDSLAVLFLENSLPRLPHSELAVACGPAALSAFVGLTTVRSLTSLHKRGLEGFVNRRDMEASLRELSISFVRCDDKMPKCGLTIIQWEGPWLDNVYRGSNLRHTHWIAVVDDYIFDVLWGEWLPQTVWHEIVVEEMMARNEADGWHVLSSYELTGC